jgi:surface polysaccharide O-acyltransferase-like enzyme
MAPESRADWLDATRVVAICAVVVVHVASIVINWDSLGSLNWWAGNLYESASRWCVPVFVMVSGALLLDPRKSESLREFYGKRMSRILVPTAFWSLFFLAYGWKLGLAPGKPEIGLVPLTPEILMDRIRLGEPHYHLWFLYMLVGLYAFTPFFRKIVAHSTRLELKVFSVAGLLIAGVSFLFGRYTHNPVNVFLGAFVYYIPCFFLGYLIKTSPRQFPMWFLGSGIALGILATAFGFYSVTKKFGMEKGEYFYGYMSFNVVLMSCLLMFLFKKISFSFLSQPLRFVGGLVLGVYLVHPIFLDLLCAWGHGPLSRNRIFSIPLVSLAVLFLSLASVFLMSRVPFLRRVT